MFGGVRWGLCAAVLALAVAPVACGSDDDQSSTTEQKAEFAAANEPEEVFIKRMARLLATVRSKKDCAELEQINVRSMTRFPCPPDKELRKSMENFEVVGAADYGTGAVVDYKSGQAPDGATIVLFTSLARNWSVSRFGVLTKPSVGTSDENGRFAYEDAVGDYLDAVRRRDCKAFKEAAFTGDSNGNVCKGVFGATGSLAKRLKENPSAVPRYLGGNNTYGFFSLETQKPEPENSTISVVRGEDANVVLDVALSPTAAELRRAERQYRRQQKSEVSGMQPSTSGKKPLPQEDN